MSEQRAVMTSERWNTLSLVEQMANIGSEVERGLKWKDKNNETYCVRAVDRALVLFDLTLECRKTFAQLKEIARARELVVDFFFCENSFSSSGQYLRTYFLQFACAARKNR